MENQTMQAQTMFTKVTRKGLHKNLTGAQLVMIMEMRAEIGMPKLTNHNISCLSIDAASRMIEDLIIYRDTMMAMKEEIEMLKAKQMIAKK